VGDVVRPVGFALAEFGVAVAVLSRLVLPDPWLLLTSVVPVVAGLVIATGVIPVGEAAPTATAAPVPRT
jgi:hypothetical protein